jgi:hypothetical protein
MSAIGSDRLPDNRGSDPLHLAVVLCQDVTPATAVLMRSMEDRVQFYAVTTSDDSPIGFRESVCRVERLEVIHLPVDQIAADFIQLVLVHRCVTATEFLLCYLVMHACEAVPEQHISITLCMEVTRAAWTVAARVAKFYGKLLILPEASADSSDEKVRRVAEIVGQLALGH